MDLLTANPTFSCQLYGVRCQVKPFKRNQIEKGKLLIIKKSFYVQIKPHKEITAQCLRTKKRLNIPNKKKIEIYISNTFFRK